MEYKRDVVTLAASHARLKMVPLEGNLQANVRGTRLFPSNDTIRIDGVVADGR